MQSNISRTMQRLIPWTQWNMSCQFHSWKTKLPSFIIHSNHLNVMPPCLPANAKTTHVNWYVMIACGYSDWTACTLSHNHKRNRFNLVGLLVVTWSKAYVSGDLLYSITDGMCVRYATYFLCCTVQYSNGAKGKLSRALNFKSRLSKCTRIAVGMNIF